MLTRLTGTLLPINLLLIAMEFVRMIAHLLSRRVAGKVKVHQAILRYARRQGARMKAMGIDVIKKQQAHPKVALVVVNTGRDPTKLPFANQRTTLNGTLIDIHPCAAVRRLNEVARILAPLRA